MYLHKISLLAAPLLQLDQGVLKLHFYWVKRLTLPHYYQRFYSFIFLNVALLSGGQHEVEVGNEFVLEVGVNGGFILDLFVPLLEYI